VAYQSLLRERRKELHRGVGLAIEDLYSDRLTEHYEELAHHFARGEDWGKAMDYSLRAGKRAGHAFANIEAKGHYARALDAARRIIPPLEPTTLATLHVKHGAVLAVLGEYEDATAEYRRALELARRAGDRRHEVKILVGLSGVCSSSHRREPAIEYNEQALAIARELDDRALWAACLANRVQIRSAGWGQIVETTPDAEEALRISKELGDSGLLLETLNYVGGALQWRADFDRSLAYLHEAAELARRAHAGSLFGRAAFFIGHATAAKGDYEEALRWYRELSEYAEAAGDKVWLARAPNCLGGPHLELHDLDEAIRLTEEGDEAAKRFWPWPEPRGHCLVKLGLCHLYRDDHARAQEAFDQAWGLLEEDTWFRWRWHIALLRARGELAMAEGRHDEAWTFATQSLEMATQSDSRKHVVRAQRLQGQVLAATGRLADAVGTLEASVGSAESLGTPREVWVGKADLGEALARLGRDREAEARFAEAAGAIEAIAAKLTTPRLRRSFLGAEPVLEVYRRLGRRPPPAEP